MPHNYKGMTAERYISHPVAVAVVVRAGAGLLFVHKRLDVIR